MASPDTIILFIVDYHAAIGAKTPVAPSLRTPLLLYTVFHNYRTRYTLLS